MKNLTISIFILFCGAKATAQVIADSTFIHHQIVTGIDQTGYIFEGEVVNTTCYWDPLGNTIYTSNVVLVNQVWKEIDGRPLSPGRHVEVITRGGTVANEGIHISHQIGFARGQKGMFFCDNALYPPYPNTTVDPSFQLQLHDGIYFDYDYSKHYIQASYARFNYSCIDLLYHTIDPEYVIECIDVYPNGILQSLLYQEFLSNSNQKLASSTAGSGTITYTFENASTVSENGQEYFEFDIYISSSNNVYFDNGLVRILYNTDAFGTNIVANNGITVQRGDIISSMSDYFDPSPSDISANVLAIGISAGLDAQNRSAINSQPQQLIHVKMAIENCGESPDLSFTDISIMLDFSFYTSTASSPNLQFFVNIIANDTENSAMCNMEITGFSPTNVNGGTGDIVTITGQFFGTPGTVELRNADDGGATWITLDEYDIISWTASEIQIRIPSTLPLAATNENQLKVPGTGRIRIITDAGDSDESASDLIIYYSWRNYNAPLSNLKSPTVLAGRDDVYDEDGQAQSPGYRIIPHPNIANNISAMQSISTAMRQWTCETGIRWELATNETTNATSNTDDVSTIRFGNTSASNVLGETSVRDWRCAPPPGINDLGFAREIDIVISSAEIHPFFFDHTGLGNQPSDFYDFHSVVLHEFGHAHLLKHINHEVDLMFWEVLSNNSTVQNFNRKISLSQSNVDGGSAIMDHSTGINFNLCNDNDEAIVDLQLSDCSFVMHSPNLSTNDYNPVRIFPNPSSGAIILDYNSVQSDLVEIRVYNSLGQIVHQEQNLQSDIGSNQYHLNFSHLRPGFYMAYLKGLRGQAAAKFTIY